MKKSTTIITVLAIVILIAGGWYLYSQQDQSQDQEQERMAQDLNISEEENTTPAEEEVSDTKEEEEAEEEEEETDKVNPYLEAKEVPAIAGPNEKIHEITKRILTSVFEEVKLTDTDSTAEPADPKFEFLADYDYIVPEVIDMEQAGQIREGILEEGGEITSTDVDSNSYRYWYDFEMDGKTYSANMGIFVGEEEELGDRPQTIELDVRLES
ncbi:MAG: hypothetical protein R6V40_01315 [Candidatus Moraniibacteriota bacterium]